jgi:uncharacterized protein
MDWLYYLLLLGLLLCGLAIQLMSLPGLWLMAAAAGLYALVTRGQEYLSLGELGVILGFCLLGELLEFLAGAGGAKKAGGSKRSMFLGTIGGILGGLFLTIPFPIIGTIAGVCIGAFAGAALGQFWAGGGEVGHSARVGFGAAKGTLMGILLKLCVGVVILIFTVWRALPLGAAAAPSPQPPVMPSVPSTVPSTLPSVEPA